MSHSKITTNKFTQHLLAWIILAIAWFFLRYQDYFSIEIAMIITLIKVIDIAILIYVTNLILMPQLLYKKRYTVLVISFLLMILFSSYLKMVITGQVLHQPSFYNLTHANLKDRIYDNVLPHIFLVIAGAAIKLIYDQSVLQQRISIIAKEKAETELQFLRAQINPHFVFNSLNAVYFLIDQQNDKARNALHKFSEMLRYQLYDINYNVSLEKEIDYIKDYIALQRLRKEETVRISFEQEGDFSNQTVAPLLLIPFVENAFKHLSTKPENNFVRIKILITQQQLHFHICNSTDIFNDSQSLSGGIGLDNVKRRLDLIYPNAYTLSKNQTGTTYSVDLNIDLKNQLHPNQIKSTSQR